MPEFCNKPVEDNLFKWCLHYHKVPNCCFKREVDTISHFTRNVLTLYTFIVQLMIMSLAAMGLVLGTPDASPNISLLWENPVNGIIALLLIFATPILAFIYIFILGKVMAQADNYNRPTVLRVILYMIFWTLIFVTIAIIGICIFIGGMAALQVVIALWAFQAFISLICCHPLFVCCCYVLRSNLGKERKEEPAPVYWCPHVCQTEEWDE